MQVFIVTFSVDEQESFDSVHLSLLSAKEHAKEMFAGEEVKVNDGSAVIAYEGERMKVNIYSSKAKGSSATFDHWTALKEHCKSLMVEGEDGDDDFFLELFKGILSDAAKLKVGGGYSYVGIGG